MFKSLMNFLKCCTNLMNKDPLVQSFFEQSYMPPGGSSFSRIGEWRCQRHVILSGIYSTNSSNSFSSIPLNNSSGTLLSCFCKNLAGLNFAGTLQLQTLMSFVLIHHYDFFNAFSCNPNFIIKIMWNLSAHSYANYVKLCEV